MNFREFDEEAIKLIKEYTAGNGYKGSDYSYYAFLGWFDNLEYAHQDGILFLRIFHNGLLKYFIPITKKNISVKDLVKMLPPKSVLTFVTEEIVEKLKDSYAIYTNRDWSEYIYDTQAFINLVGKKYSSKRNFIKRFKTSYKYTIEHIQKSDFDDIWSLENSWMNEQKLSDEDRVFVDKEKKLLQKWIDAVLIGDLVGDVVRVDGKLVGCSIGEIMPNGNAVVMYEKADTSYIGAYPFLANEFATRNLAGCKYINRQDDLGLEGLRKSKLSYNPIEIVNKYILIPESIEITDKMLEEYIKPCDPDIQIDRNEYVLRQLTSDEYNEVMAFLKCGISNLKDKKWFLNYTDEELQSALSNGYFLGYFAKGHLVSTGAIDFDTTYGDLLKKICHDKSDSTYYEVSGIMTCIFHKHKGLSHALIEQLLKYATANLKGSTLCAVIQYDNIPSLNNFKKFGFIESGEKQYKEYNFKYLTKYIPNN